MAEDLVPNAVRELLSTFETSLADVRFPDVDLPILNALVVHVGQLASGVQEAQAALDRTQAALDDARAALTAKAERALAYACIYARDEPELLARLQAVALGPRPERRRLPDRNGRRPKSTVKAADAAELPFAATGQR